MQDCSTTTALYERRERIFIQYEQGTHPMPVEVYIYNDYSQILPYHARIPQFGLIHSADDEENLLRIVKLSLEVMLSVRIR
jgi:hypothetical protein